MSKTNSMNTPAVSVMNKMDIALASYLDKVKNRPLSEDALHPVPDSDEHVIIKTYELAVPKGKKETLNVSNPDIIKSLDAMAANLKARDVLGYAFCAECGNLWYYKDQIKQMGFKDLGEFVVHVLPVKWSSTTVNQYSRIGRYFLTRLDDGSVFPRLPFPSDIPISTLLEMLAYCEDKERDTIDMDKVISWYSSGLLTDGMSGKKVRDALKGKYKALPEPKQESKQEPKPEPKQELKQGDAKQGDDVSFFDSLDNYDKETACNTALQALQVVKAICDKFDVKQGENPNAVNECLSFLHSAIQSMIN